MLLVFVPTIPRRCGYFDRARAVRAKFTKMIAVTPKFRTAATANTALRTA